MERSGTDTGLIADKPAGGRIERIRIDQHSASGMLWLAGWLFTIGYLHLPFWKAVLAIVLWPWYIGASF